MSDFILIDDNATFARLLKRSMERQGHNLIWCENAAAALSLQDAGDGIILDLNLGEDSGLKLLPELHQRFPDTKIVILTGYASINTAVSAIKLGACEYLPKPADIDTEVKEFIDAGMDLEAIKEAYADSQMSAGEIEEAYNRVVNPVSETPEKGAKKGGSE